MAARDAGGTSDSDSSVGAISHPGYMHEAVSRPLDLLTTKPQARIKWGSIDGGGGGGGGVSAAGNTKPPTVWYYCRSGACVVAAAVVLSSLYCVATGLIWAWARLSPHNCDGIVLTP